MGGGAGSLMAASVIKSKSVALIEHNGDIGAKIKISGGGRCNITNRYLGWTNYLGEKSFVQSVIERFTNKDLLKFFKEKGLKPVLRKENQFFCPHSSDDILGIFKKELKNISVFLKYEILDVEKVEDFFIVRCDKESFKAKFVLVATGGISYKKLGASDIGYKIAQKFGHSIVPLKPALVGFTVQKDEFWFKNLSGISFRARVKTAKKEIRGDILFAHRGISGPAMLNASLYWDRGKISVDFLDDKKLEELLRYKNRQLISQLPLPKRFVKEFLYRFGLIDKPVKNLGKKEIEILKLLESYEFAPAGTFGFERAEVTKGGISTDEIDPLNMESKKVKNLFFAGEVLNVTGELGGYNFQWAFSSGYIAGKYIDECP
ncbi:NAD(P)/FAD-dependent oxidoreductase [Nitrosophilus alvini]|uniref:NAD(P)/FAD-dependent oxidoreductase n=1 Tax=Nitrosophilus alvini TaxID=2714855 RepID=UPI003B82CDF0